ncbi:hypothetical protein ACIHAR_02635 [Streptomyces sp. NPDC052016]|uniref:hypothetical protein n=1 Tax=Streptomyces sp. NPDC052016 TaxID=3365680 RepID=UPI0037D04FB0
MIRTASPGGTRIYIVDDLCAHASADIRRWTKVAYLTDVADGARLNAAYARFFTSPRPRRS